MQDNGSSSRGSGAGQGASSPPAGGQGAVVPKPSSVGRRIRMRQDATNLPAKQRTPQLEPPGVRKAFPSPEVDHRAQDDTNKRPAGVASPSDRTAGGTNSAKERQSSKSGLPRKFLPSNPQQSPSVASTDQPQPRSKKDAPQPLSSLGASPFHGPTETTLRSPTSVSHPGGASAPSTPPSAGGSSGAHANRAPPFTKIISHAGVSPPPLKHNSKHAAPPRPPNAIHRQRGQDAPSK